MCRWRWRRSSCSRSSALRSTRSSAWCITCSFHGRAARRNRCDGARWNFWSAIEARTEGSMKALGVSGVVAALVCAASLYAAPARAADSVTLQLDWVPSGIAAGWYYGVTQKCFSNQNIDVTIKRGYGAGDAITKVATGVSEFGV